MVKKPYSTYERRISILESRNMTINKNLIEHTNVLKSYNYYNVVNGYKDLFLDKGQKEERYLQGTTPDQLLALYEFDEELRLVLLRYLLKIEEKLKHYITQSFYDFYNSSEQITDEDKENLYMENTYLSKIFYDTASPEKEKTYNKFVSKVSENIAIHQRRNSSIKKYKEEHRYIPMWVLFNILMFGNISKYFTILKKDIKKEVMKKLDIKWTYQLETETIGQFEDTLEILTLTRNFSAHNERLYCFKHNMVLKDRYLNFRNALPHVEDLKYPNRSEMKFGIFSSIFLITKFISKKEKEELVDSLIKAREKLKDKLVTINIDDVFKHMNMNHNWEELLLK